MIDYTNIIKHSFFRNKMRNFKFFLIKNILGKFKGRGHSQTAIGKFLYKNVFLKIKPNYIVFDGFKIYLHKEADLLSEALLLGYDLDSTMRKLALNNLKKGDVVIDLGANIGYHTLKFSRIVGDTGKVYAFEPDPNNFKLLEKNIKENNCKNVIAYQKAVCEKKGQVKLNIWKGNFGGNSIYNDKNIQEKKQVIVESIVLDDYFVNEKVDFMKIDIEGAEFSALKGAKNILKNKNLKMIIEFNFPWLFRIKEDPKKLLGLLEENCFKLNNINEETREISQISKEELLTQESVTNLFCHR